MVLDAVCSTVLLPANARNKPQATGSRRQSSNHMSVFQLLVKVCSMERRWTRLVLGGMALVPLALANAQSPQLATASAGNRPAASTVALPDILPVPTGKSTIMGGSIGNFDPVRDQFTLHVYGIKPLKILFDARTQVFRDGKRIPLRDLGPAEHASVETTLADGQVFALSIHILSKLVQGDYQGQVVSYDPQSGDLVLSSATGGQPFRLAVTQSTSIKRQGQAAFATAQSGATDLVPGTLVSIKFDTDKGKGTATEITVLATPGATFLFAGTITALDEPSGTLVVLDPRYNMTYQISFDPHTSGTANLRVGQHVRISANYDGHHYVATSVQPE